MRKRRKAKEEKPKIRKDYNSHSFAVIYIAIYIVPSTNRIVISWSSRNLYNNRTSTTQHISLPAQHFRATLLPCFLTCNCSKGMSQVAACLNFVWTEVFRDFCSRYQISFDALFPVWENSGKRKWKAIQSWYFFIIFLFPFGWNIDFWTHLLGVDWYITQFWGAKPHSVMIVKSQNYGFLFF